MTDAYAGQVQRQRDEARAELAALQQRYEDEHATAVERAHEAARVREQLASAKDEWAQDVRTLDRIRSEWREQDDRLKDALRTDEHHMIMWAGLPFCSCKLSLAGGDATGSWIAHRLAAVREMLDGANSQSATTSSQISSCPDPIECGHEAALGQAEARIAAVRTLVTSLRAEAERAHGGRYDGLHQAADDIEAALAGPAEQPADDREPPSAEAGRNAEDCPACDSTNPPYPFICPGHPAGGVQ